MPLSDIEERVRAVFARVLEVEPERITAASRFEQDLGADSLDVFRVVLAMEEEFGTAIADEEVECLDTVGGLIRWLSASVPA